MTEQPESTVPADTASTDPELSAHELNDQMAVRAAKRQAAQDAGMAPYPVDVHRTTTLAAVREQFGQLEAGEETEHVVTVAGRVVHVRNTGKLCFATLQEGDGTRLQAMLSKVNVGDEPLAQWKALVDLGDFVAITGRVISSRRGELSVMADSWTMASKALRPLPTMHKELNEETRVRQRYLDLIVRQEARDVVLTRSTITRTVRRVMEEQGYVEIETPVLQLVHGGAAARPFGTHLNAFDQDMTLRIATELYLKRAVVGGIDRVFEIGRVFRNEGVDSSHSPEFTTLEAYEAYADQFVMAQRIQEIIQECARALGVDGVDTEDGRIDLFGEWAWVSVYPGLSEAVGREVTPDTDVTELRKIAAQRDIQVNPAWDAQKLVMELFEEIVEPTLIQPTFVYDYPPAAQPLARPHREKPGLIEAWDLIIGGMERGTAFSELVDPVVQRDRLTEQSRLAAAGDDEAMQLDEDFLRALEYGAPPMGGLGLGLDRLIMLFTNLGIRDTILFPLMKPE
ncbi:lysine--tRNA ligase [Kocuria indica]|uniref:Lysine--tRNA ligase n=2 Tax=Kocuria marina TaxID=223184 RepID=A0A1X7DXY7_9MICC|nr:MULTISPECIES: lysine--tRNA ligase [Kocuria]MCG7431853.1 lysine--tRNA ligase [Kocuria indica]OXS81149.1 lysine--tRNA ligase [Kocuria indica]RLP56970.1 lysine--tRNA ligase [Kocuria indica]SMF23854.1 lysyl-tRNA synthetase, class II [Kocuria indica]